MFWHSFATIFSLTDAPFLTWLNKTVTVRRTVHEGLLKVGRADGSDDKAVAQLQAGSPFALVRINRKR
jgi:hypothetical protein